MPSTNPFLDHLELFHFRTRDDRFLTAESCTAGANIVLLQEIKRSDSLSDPTLPWTQIWRISDGRLINACSTSDLSIVITIVSDLGVGGVRTLQEISGAQFQLAPESAINDHFELEFISDGGVSIKYTPISLLEASSTSWHRAQRAQTLNSAVRATNLSSIRSHNGNHCYSLTNPYCCTFKT